ncbi:MAG: hypothetical protein VZQ75_00180 [Candidatus Faecousia sp.]|nr:hypothetical protein [Candidatus Faecousia sp.]
MGKKPYVISTFSGAKGELPSARLVGSSGGGGGGGGSVTVDAALSETSENPVQNKVIAEALTGKVSVSQGTANAGKFLIVGSDGMVAPVAMTAWQGGSY